MKNNYTQEQDDNIIEVSKNTSIEKLIYFCQKSLNVKHLKKLNLCAIGTVIEILDKTFIELMNQNPELYRLNKLTSFNQTIKLDVKLILGKPNIIPEGYKDEFNEEENQKLYKIYNKNQLINNDILINENKDSSINNKNELKIILYPEKQPRYHLKKEPISTIITKDVLQHSLNINQNLAYLNRNAPLLSGFYTAHINHYPIRIKPDDIWLLIVQAFSNHVNANSEELRNYFVNFDGKKELIVKFDDIRLIHEVTKKHLEDFSDQINKQMIEYLGEEILDYFNSKFLNNFL